MYALMIPKAFNMFFIHLQRTLRPFSTTFIADLFFLNVLLITDFIIYFIPDICFIVLWYFISSPYYISSKLLWKMYYSLFLSFKNFNPKTLAKLEWLKWIHHVDLYWFEGNRIIVNENIEKRQKSLYSSFTWHNRIEHAPQYSI